MKLRDALDIIEKYEAEHLKKGYMVFYVQLKFGVNNSIEYTQDAFPDIETEDLIATHLEATDLLDRFLCANPHILEASVINHDFDRVGSTYYKKENKT